MGTNIIIYLSELIVMVVAILIAVIIFKLTHKKGLSIFCSIAVPIFVAIFVLTFVFEKPEININEKINIEIGTDERVNMPKAMYHFQDVTKQIKMNGYINYSKPDTYKVNYEIDTIMGPYVKGVTVTVADTKGPEIILNGEEEYIISYKKEYIEPGFKALDDYEGDLTSEVKVKQEKIDDENINIIYEAQDSSGNKTEKIRRIKIIDDICPVITINGNRNIIIALNSEYKDFCLYVIESRGIPSAIDSLTPVQRLILSNAQPHLEKTLSLSGRCISDGYHHGDSSLNGAIGNLAKSYLASYPILEMSGFAGNQVAPNPASPRYTQVKLNSKINTILKQYAPLNKYDENTEARFPLNVEFPIGLLNLTLGIAVGFATSILPRDFKEIEKFLA